MTFPTNPRFGRRVALSATVMLVSLSTSGTVLAQQAAKSTKTNTSRVPPTATTTAKPPAKAAPVYKTMDDGIPVYNPILIPIPPPFVPPVDWQGFPQTGGGSGTPPTG